MWLARTKKGGAPRRIAPGVPVALPDIGNQQGRA